MPDANPDPTEAHLAFIAAVWRLLDENGGDFGLARDQFENALSAWTPDEATDAQEGSAA